MKFAEHFSGNGKRILIVEDDENVLEFTRRALRTCGYDVVGMGNARDTLSLFEREGFQFDIVFSDVELPDQSGIVLAQLLSKMNPNIKVVLTSGHSSGKYTWANFEKKGYRFLEKPYPLTELLRIIRETAGCVAS